MRLLSSRALSLCTSMTAVDCRCRGEESGEDCLPQDVVLHFLCQDLRATMLSLNHEL